MPPLVAPPLLIPIPITKGTPPFLPAVLLLAQHPSMLDPSMLDPSMLNPSTLDPSMVNPAMESRSFAEKFSTNTLACSRHKSIAAPTDMNYRGARCVAFHHLDSTTNQ
jgi:hypothetical protein